MTRGADALAAYSEAIEAAEDGLFTLRERRCRPHGRALNEAAEECPKVEEPSSTPEALAEFERVAGHTLSKEATVGDLYALYRREHYYEPQPDADEIRCQALGCKRDVLVKTSRSFSGLVQPILLYAMYRSVEQDDGYRFSQVAVKHKERTLNFETGADELIIIRTAPDKSQQVPSSFQYLAKPVGGGQPVIFRLKPEYDCIGLNVWAANKQACEQFCKWFDKQIEKYNYLRGQKIDGKGQFLDVEEMSWDDIVLPPGIKQRIERDVMALFQKEKIYLANGLAFKRGFALIGPPGTGKTTLFKVLANEMRGVTLILVTPDAMGYGASSVAAIFDLATMLAPTLLAFEDADIFLAARGSGFSNDPVLSEIMQRLDGIKPLKGVVTGISTNRPQVLEQALIDRQGRIDLKIFMGPLDKKGNATLLTRTLRKVRFEAKDVEQIAADPRIAQFTGSAVVDIGKRAIMRAIDDGRYDRSSLQASVTYDDLTHAVDEMLQEKQIGADGDYTGNMKQESGVINKLFGSLREAVGLDDGSEQQQLAEAATFDEVLDLVRAVLGDDDPQLDSPLHERSATARQIKRLVRNRRLLRRHGISASAQSLAGQVLKGDDITLRQVITALTGDE